MTEMNESLKNEKKQIYITLERPKMCISVLRLCWRKIKKKRSTRL